MSRSFGLAAFLFVLILGAPVSGAPTMPMLVFPQQVGDSLHYRITRTTQAVNGTQTKMIDVIVVRKSPTMAALSRVTASGQADVTVLAIATDGSIQIPQIDQTDRQDPDFSEVLTALNRAIAIARNANADPRTGWDATLTLTGTRGANASVTVPMHVANTKGNDFDVDGLAQSALGPQENGGQAAPEGGGSFPGGRRRGGFPGGDFPNSGSFPRGNRGNGTRSTPISLTVRIDGHVRNGLLNHLAVVETRTVTIDDVPFTNTRSWIIEATRP
jgi:hypothetical protein